MSRLFTECILACRGVLSSLLAGVNRSAKYFCYTAGSDLNLMNQDTVRLVAGILLVLIVVIIILRRKGKKTKGDDEF